MQGCGATDYGGLYGEAIGPHPSDGSWVAENGVMIYDRAFSVTDIRDGTSNTLAVAENSLFAVWTDGQWINGLNIFDQKYAINFIPSDTRLIEDEIRSGHPGGANGTFCDGSAQMINYTISMTVHGRLCNRKDGQVIDAKSF